MCVCDDQLSAETCTNTIYCNNGCRSNAYNERNTYTYNLWTKTTIRDVQKQQYSTTLKL